MTRRRFMQKPETERRIMYGALWFIAGCVILAILTSCSPYTAQIATGNSTVAPSMTPEATVPQVTLSPTPRPITCTVTAYALNMRTAGTMRAAVVRILERGEVVTVLERDGWLKVATRNTTGFIYARYCK